MQDVSKVGKITWVSKANLILALGRCSVTWPIRGPWNLHDTMADLAGVIFTLIIEQRQFTLLSIP